MFQHKFTFILAFCLMGTLSSHSMQGRVAAARGTVPPCDWPQFNFDARHSGNNVSEHVISSRNVPALQLRFRVHLPAVADGAPVLLGAVRMPAGLRDLLFLTTKAGHIVALDAQTGMQFWIRQYGPGSCRINNGSESCYTTSSPVIDPSREFVYSYGLDGYVHKYRAKDGFEIKGGGWPELATLKAFNEKGSSALSIAVAADGKAYLYIANGGYLGDRGDYQGHLTAVSLADGSQRVFNANCSDKTVHFGGHPGEANCPARRSAIWARAGVVYDSDTGKIYLATGNGPFSPAHHDWGDTVFALNPDGTGMNGNPLDSYTPDNYRELENNDADLGSTTPAILPVPAGCAVKHLAVQGGKDEKLRLINLDDLSGKGEPGHNGGEIRTLGVPQGGMVLTAPAVWVNPATGGTWLFVANSRGISALRLVLDARGVPALRVTWKSGEGATSPIIANNVLYCAGNNNIRALDPTTGVELWHDRRIGKIHWESPILANGVLYITDEDGNLWAFASPTPPRYMTRAPR